MYLFKNRLLKEYKQNEKLLLKRYEAYLDFIEKKEAIYRFKEEEYQEGFLKDLFEKALGYTLKTTNPKSYNLVRELKSEVDSKKSDGAIVVDGQVVGVIELKDTKTKNLDSVEIQAFNYLNSHSFAKYVIISNFEKLRFYIEKRTAYEEFNLFELNFEDFKRLHTILSFESIKNHIPLKLKEKSVNFEAEITKELYRDYHEFRLQLFENIVKNNPHKQKLKLLNLTQKLCDRIVFILFCEDRGLLKPNTIREIRERYKDDLFGYTLYDYYKIYFDAIDKGNEKLQIPRYNGGLFSKDEELDNLKIDDESLDLKAQKLSDYDFLSDIDVNILGHIFEQSLNDLEELSSEIENRSFEKKKSKRKKDGVFYTPKYIVEYILNETLGTLCKEKQEALNILEVTAPKNPKKPTKKELETKNALLEYKEWLFNLKILDPACGSGAFLNGCLEFLIKEHKKLQKKLSIMGDITAYYDVEVSILEHNLYGVDINYEAVEIARLSLWLRSAQKGRTLTDLSDKIIQANSLLDDPFNGIQFDVVIGNPPYFNIQTLGAKSPIAQQIQNKYANIWQDKSDILFYFIAYAIERTKSKVGFIVSNAFLHSAKAVKLRNFILDNAPIEKIINFEKYHVFEDASITSAIIILNKEKKDTKLLATVLKEKKYSIDEVVSIISNLDNYFSVKLLKDSVFALVDEKVDCLNRKIDADYPKVKELFKIGKGMETAANSVFLFKEYPSHFPKEFIRKRISGEIIKKYFIEKEKEYILYFEDVESFEDLPESIQNHLLKNRDFLENRADKKRRKTSKWWNYTFPMHKEYYHLDKLWCSYRAKENIFCFDDTKEYIGLTNTTVIFDTNKEVDLKYLLALLNSKLLNFRYRSIGKQTGSGIYEYFENGVGKLPIPKIPKSIERYKQNIDYLLTLPKKKIYDKETKYAIGEYDGKEIYITEFLIAKQLGNIEKFQGHSELKEYIRLLPFIFGNKMFDEVFQNIDNKRFIYSIFYNEADRIFHVIDENNFLVSIYVNSSKNFNKQLNRKFKKVSRWEGGYFSILSPAEPFWRHLPTLERLYQDLEKSTITQEEFVTLVDEILEAKKQIMLYKKHFDSLSAKEKIEIKEEIEKLEKKIEEDIEKIDYLTFKLYKLDDDEIKLIEAKI